MAVDPMVGEFCSLIGNDQIKHYLLKLSQNGAIPHSLLFSGPEGVGKSLFAGTFAKLIVGSDKETHPDIHHYRPEGKVGMHPIQSMREFSEMVYLAPFQSQKKVFIIHDAHRMLTYSANALLKTFEEPALDSVIILVTHAPEQLLPTVLSRCRSIRFQPIQKDSLVALLIEQKGISKEKAEHIAIRSRGSIGKALRSEEEGQHTLRELMLSRLAEGFLEGYPDILQCSKEFADLIESEVETESNLLQQQFFAAFPEKPSAHQKQMIEKEVEGFASMKKNSETKILFEVLLSWHRDLQLLRVCGPSNLLINADHEEKLIQAFQKGSLRSIETVEKAVTEAILAVERSTSLNICLENLFLKLSK